jgi:hypothetical protein
MTKCKGLGRKRDWTNLERYHHTWLQGWRKHRNLSCDIGCSNRPSSPQQTSSVNSSCYASRITWENDYADWLSGYYITLLQLQMLQNIKWDKTSVMLVLDYFMTIAWLSYALSNCMKSWLFSYYMTLWIKFNMYNSIKLHESIIILVNFLTIWPFLAYRPEV